MAEPTILSRALSEFSEITYRKGLTQGLPMSDTWRWPMNYNQHFDVYTYILGKETKVERGMSSNLPEDPHIKNVIIGHQPAMYLFIE